MTAFAITGMGLTGVLRITWVHDNLAHVLHHSHTHETPGTWTGLACPGHGLALGTDVDNETLQHLAVGNEIADLTWEAPDELAAEHARAFNGRHARSPDTGECRARRPALGGPPGRLVDTPGQRTTRCSSSCRAPVCPGSRRSSPSSWVVASFEHHTSPARPTPPPRAQYRPDQPDNGGERALTWPLVVDGTIGLAGRREPRAAGLSVVGPHVPDHHVRIPARGVQVRAGSSSATSPAHRACPTTPTRTSVHRGTRQSARRRKG